MKRVATAVITDIKGAQTVKVFEKYVTAETFVRDAKKSGNAVSGYACESRYGFEDRAKATEKPNAVKK